MATLLSALETQARRHLKETTASFWSSAELIDLANQGIKDLWGAIVDLHQEHFLTVDTSNVSLAVDGTSLSGVPTDVFRVHLIEHADTTDSPGNRILFTPSDYNSPEFINARSYTSQDPSSGIVIHYALTKAGAPVAAPTVLTAPKLSTALAAGDIRFVYVPTPAAVAAGGDNPIPGESDNALIAWMVAFARAKEREDRSPDPNWLAVYKTEKQSVCVRLTPRQTQEPEVTPDFFAAWW
jgi:hypothetical protein